MIRLANISDRETIIAMLEEYKEASPLYFHRNTSDGTARKLLNSLFENNFGFVFLDEKEGQARGMLIAFRNCNIWDSQVYCMNELAFWVKPEYRNRTVGHRLLKAYKEACEFMMKKKEISYYTISKMSTSPDLKYEKQGFKYLEETWACQQA